MIQSILVCLDGSPRAPLVFDMAAEIAVSFGATLRILRVATDAPESSIEELARMAERAPRALVAPPMVREGLLPWRGILASSDELDVDLIVLGSHGYRRAADVLGTTAMRVVSLARRPVLVVRDRLPP